MYNGRFWHAFGVEGMWTSSVQLFVSGTPYGVERMGMAGVQLGVATVS